MHDNKLKNENYYMKALIPYLNIFITLDYSTYLEIYEFYIPELQDEANAYISFSSFFFFQKSNFLLFMKLVICYKFHFIFRAVI